MSFQIYQSTTRPKLEVQVLDADGNACNLTGCSLALYVGKVGDAAARIVTAAPMNVPTPMDGLAEYAFTAVQTATAGQYDAQIEITWADASKSRTVPILVEILEVV